MDGSLIHPSADNAAPARLMAGGRVQNYVRIARPDHWIKNIFVLPGFAVALALVPHAQVSFALFATLALALIGVCLTASANYTINEYLDAEFDRHHPLKRNRPGAIGMLDARLVALQYTALAAGALLIAIKINQAFFMGTLWLLLMGIAYNVRPLRAKDRAYLDVLIESINNPIRFLLGWFAVTADLIPPSTALLAYWMGGAFLMAVKRFSEYRRIGDPARAARYRRSFAQYSENALLLSAFFFAISSSFFIGIFLVKYQIGLVLTFPCFAALFTWYLGIGLRRDSAAQAPEKLYREAGLMCLAAATFVLTLFLCTVPLPFLNLLTETQLLRLP